MKSTLFLFLAVLIASSMAWAAEREFKLYKEPNARVTPLCDKFTRLVLDVDGNIGSAVLTDHVAGACEVKVLENRRSYNLVIADTKCGSQIYRQDDDSDSAVEVVDNSTRECDDKIPALIVLTEYNSRGKPTVLYSKDH